MYFCKDQKGGESEHINLKVLGQDNAVVQFKIKKHTPLRKLMNAYCDRAVTFKNRRKKIWSNEFPKINGLFISFSHNRDFQCKLFGSVSMDNQSMKTIRLHRWKWKKETPLKYTNSKPAGKIKQLFFFFFKHFI